ncbi:MAG: sugar transferase [Anaerolineae bacterium]|nr:sugar transferase [Anaerolineae bacterium]MCA9909553.1 sugar transferase [Anaerolineae bacterium]
MKRTFDVIVSLALFGLILPLILIVVLLLYFEDGSPILQKQCQIGAGGQLFCVYTFRTKLRHDTERPSAFGRFLIATCLDRLPIFLNIFTGQMSLVGPALIAYAPGVTLTDRSRASLCMSPGLFQARDERAYLENYSIWSDIQVLLTNCNAHLQ